MPKPSDTDTKTLILDAAEQAFADLGFDAASLRHIIAVAGVNLAAVHYHFGSKEALIRAVFDRRIGPLNTERLAMLDQIETDAGKNPPQLDEIIRAMIEPALKLARDPKKGGPDVMRLFGRMIAEPGEDLQRMLHDQFGGVTARFGVALAKACPDLPAAVLIWRFHFMIGAMGHVMADPTQMNVFTAGKCNPNDTVEVVRQMTSFLAAGFRAPADKPAKKKKKSARGSGLKSIAAALILVTAAGCSTTIPESSNAPPKSWSVAAVPGNVADRWWESFGDSNLVYLVEEALVENHDLKAMKARIDAAREQSRIIGADRLPSLDAQFGSQRQQQIFVGFPIPGETGPLKTRSTAHTFNLVANWELDLWGRVRSGRKAALADYLAATDDLRGARLSLVAQTVRGWLRLVESRQQLDLATRTAELFGSTSRTVRDRYERGLVSPLDLRLALSSESSAKALVHLRKSETNNAKRQLEALLGRYPAGTLDPAIALPELIADIPAGLPSELLERRPDLQAAKWRLEAATRRTTEAKAGRLPRISLTAGGGRTSSALGDLLDHDFSLWSIAGNAAQPIFQGGRLRSNVRLQKARVRASYENYESAILTAFREVETSLANESFLKARETELENAATQAKAAETLATTRYQAGLEPFVSVLESQRRSLDSEGLLLAVRRHRLDNRVALHLALGGGFLGDEKDTLKKEISE
jgi:NodT family efflux transporter outer membrane factor (OMF) lipoprotein